MKPTYQDIKDFMARDFTESLEDGMVKDEAFERLLNDYEHFLEEDIKSKLAFLGTAVEIAIQNGFEKSEIIEMYIVALEKYSKEMSGK